MNIENLVYSNMLIPGMLIEFNDGTKGIVTVKDFCGNIDLCITEDDGHYFILKNEDFDENWNCNFNSKLNIRRIWSCPRFVHDDIPFKFDTTNREVVWERKEILEVTMREVCEKFGCEVRIITE